MPMSDDFKERLAIEAVLVRYATALDSRDYAQLDQVFLPDATARYVGVEFCRGRDQIVSFVSTVLQQCSVTQHLLGNFRIEIAGDTATAKCYLQAIHTGKGEFSEALHTVWGEYSDQLQRTESGWLIRHRELKTLHATGDIGIVLD
jgi:ketosteroid isomerase-like protein